MMFATTRCAWCDKMMEPLRTRKSGIWQCFYCFNKLVICDDEKSAQYIEPKIEDDNEE